MDFSLSSSLVGSAVLNADKLSLDLQFAADKTLTARKGPTPTFTRASTATVVGSNGLVRYAPNNSSLYSGQLVVGTGWSANATPSVTSIVDGLGPDGNNAYTITETTANTAHTLGNTGGATGSGATSTVNGTVYTGSIFLKKVTGSVDWIQVTLGSGGFGTAQYANFNINTGVVGNFAGLPAGVLPRIENYGNGWYRCSISPAATTTSSSSIGVLIAFTNNINVVNRLSPYIGNTNNKVLAAMCQFETGAFATSYIPTVASSVVRSADVCSITGSAFTGFYSINDGTLFSNCSVNNTTGTNRGIASIRSGATFFMRQSLANGSVRAEARANDTQSNIGTTSVSVLAAIKMALAYSGDDFASSTNGASPSLLTRTLPTGLNEFRIGSLDGTLCLNGHIDQIRYFRKRLDNAKLQALTV